MTVGQPLDPPRSTGREPARCRSTRHGRAPGGAGRGGRSRTSLRAAAYAAGLARRQGLRPGGGLRQLAGRLHRVMSGVVAGAVQQTHDELAEDLRQECRRGAEELGLPVTFLCRRGDAYAELCAAADEARADLVVVGSSEQAGHRLLGSVATRLVRTGRWPVVVVP
ncbi:universal stress protein [Micromonospora sp. ATA32]|nr:universal stress protein [Micromonospora sp. ATA32]